MRRPRGWGDTWQGSSVPSSRRTHARGSDSVGAAWDGYDGDDDTEGQPSGVVEAGLKN